MKYQAWTWKAVEGRVLEMADTLRLMPKHKGPKEYGSAMPEAVRRHEEAYGSDTAHSKETASAANLERMEQVWTWVNSYLSEPERKLIYAWSWVKVRKGMKIAAFAAENDMSDRMLRREIVKLCSIIANNLNQITLVRLNSEDCSLSENEGESDQSDVTSNNCGTIRQNGIAFGMTADARPILDLSSPELAALNQRLMEGNQRREREARRRAKLEAA